MHDTHRLHAVLLAVAAGEKGIRRGELARRFRARALGPARRQLRFLLDELVQRRILACEAEGRTARFRPGPAARAFLLAASAGGPAGVRYRAAEVAALLRFLAGSTAGAETPAGPDVIAAVRALAARTATGLVSLAELRRRTGLERHAMHAAVRRLAADGVLMLHPIAARHQVSAADTEDSIRTPGGQDLFYVELVQGEEKAEERRRVTIEGRGARGA
ncbi:MAG: hypothetical protein JXQ29_00160 [Planctomycetes bacterium]|nr:hypothetical protein [Planctomycetota bacterium]